MEENQKVTPSGNLSGARDPAVYVRLRGKNSSTPITSLDAGLLVLATIAYESSKLLDLVEIKSDQKSRRECDGLHGPYFRYEKTAALALQARLGWMYGTTPQGGLKPTVQAYRKKQVPREPKNRVKFCTPVEPRFGGPQLLWDEDVFGVFIHDSETVKIPIRVL